MIHFLIQVREETRVQDFLVLPTWLLPLIRSHGVASGGSFWSFLLIVNESPGEKKSGKLKVFPRNKNKTKYLPRNITVLLCWPPSF